MDKNIYKSKKIEKLEIDFNDCSFNFSNCSETKKDINMDEIKDEIIKIDKEINMDKNKDEIIKIDKDKPDFKDFDGFEYNKSDLTIDGLMNTETQLRRLKFLDKKYSIKPKPEIIETTRKVILLSLNKMEKPLLFNTYNLKPKEKKKLQTIMHTYNDISKEDIDIEFNDVCAEKLFNEDNNYSNVPIYNN